MHDILFKDLGWKLLSVFLAVAIWLTVHKILSESPEINPAAPESTLIYSNLPVAAVSSSSDIRGYRLDPPMVVVTLTGPANLMAQLEEDQIHTIVDLTAAATNRASRAMVQISPPRGVTVLNVSPDGVTVHPPEKP
jgi:YbbR domain-containing protein